jgi:hypothetical protein
MKTKSLKGAKSGWVIGFAVLIALISASPVLSQQTNTFPQTGNTGIGTVSPTYPLQVEGASGDPIYAQGYFKNTSGGYPYGGLAVDAVSQSHVRFMLGGTLKWQWRVAAGNGVDDLRAYNWAPGADVLTLKNNGNVGIGTTNPTSPLFVTGNELSADYATLRVKPTVTHGGIVIDSANDSSQVHLRFYKNGVPKWQLRVPFQNGSDDFRIYSWAANGDVLTISPTGDLSVAGNLAAKYQGSRMGSLI